MRSKEIKSNGNAAQHFFLYLVSFLALTFLVIGWGNIVFQFINKFSPDPLMAAYEGVYDQLAVKFGIAAVFVAAPIFYLVWGYIVKQLRKGIIGEDSKVRRWLTYIVLFFASATIIGDLIASLFNFLSGEITIRFVLKALVILLIALSLFGYFFWDMRKKHMLHKVYPLNKLVLYVSLGTVSVVFTAAFFLIDKPSVAREKKIDQQTVSDLQNADNNLRAYFNEANRLPEKLNELDKTNFAIVFAKSSMVAYLKTGENTFDLCAEFKRSNIADFQVPAFYALDVAANTWEHKSGKVCFERMAVKAENTPTPLK